MRVYFLKKIVTIILLLFYFKGLGQSASKLKFYHFNTSNGLGSSNVRKTLQDSYGFTWVGTQDGLFRFDGNRFIKYNSGLNNKYSISGSDVRDLLVDNNILWCVTSFGGIDGINIVTGNNICSWSQQNHQEMKDAVFLSLASVGDSLYIGSTKGVLIFNKITKTLEPFKLHNKGTEGYQILNVNKILKTDEDMLWIFCEKQGVYLFNLLRSEATGYIRDTSVRYYDCTLLKDKKIACGTSDGIKIYSNQGDIEKGHTDFYPVALKWKGEHIFSIKQDMDENIWFSDKNNLIKSDKSLATYSIVRQNLLFHNADWTQDVYNINFDSANILWLSCQQGLAYSNNRMPPFLAFSKSLTSSEFIPHSYYIFPLNDSIDFICATNGLYRVNESATTVDIIDKNKAYFYVFKDYKKRVVVSNDEGTFILNNKTLTPISVVYSEFKKIGTLVLNSHIQLSDSVYILGSQNRKGVFVWNTKRRSLQNISDTSTNLTLKENLVNTLYNDIFGDVWILCDNSVSIYNPIRNTISELPIVNPVGGKKYSIFFDVVLINDNYYIASYSNGVIVLDKNRKFLKIITAKEGLTNNGVYKLLPYRDSLLFITTNNGLSVLNVKSRGIRNYFEESGLHSNEFEELSGNKYGNKILAGGEKGYTVIFPDNFINNNSKPVFYFSGVSIETSKGIIDTSNLDVSKVSIPTNSLQTTIYFSGLNYNNPNRTSFSYRIKEKSELWSTPSSQNYINIIGLSPGTYHLQAQAFNEEGMPGETKELTLIFLPKWYQTWLFKILLFLSIALFFYGLYKFRMNHIKKEEKIRNQVAGDLHDELGSTLNSVKIFASLALIEKDNKRHLEKIKEATQSAIAGVKDIIWVLDDKRDTLEHLIMRINQFAKPLCEAADISYQQQTDAGLDEFKLGKEEKRNLYMIIKESINNSIKYAGCETIQFIINNTGGKLSIVISDDGKGFDKEKIISGYGLKNILRRSKEIGYHSAISSSPGNGTVIQLKKV